MEHGFWKARWDEMRIGFHQDSVNPWLAQYGEKLGPPGRVLVPLCGKSLDLAYLADAGHEVVGVEFVEKAVEQFFRERGTVPSRAARGDALVLEAEPITLLVADFFQLSAETLGPISAIYDRAALVAIEPERRGEYIEHLRSLAAASAVREPRPALLLINFVHDMPAGPPFSIPEAELRTLLDHRFTMSKLEDQDVLDQESNFRKRGATFLREQVWAGALA